MANLVSIATGNFLTASTWALVDAGSYLNAEGGPSVCPTASGTTARSAGTTTGAITIKGIAVKLAVRTGTTGIITIRLWNNTDSVAVAGTSVALNMSDLQAATTAATDGGWIVTNFANVLLVAAKSYMVEVFTGTASQCSLFTNGTANNWSRMLITSTTQAPVAGDDMVVAGNYTGAGTNNAFTVTMDQTAATDYGSNTTSLVTPAMAVAAKGVLKFKDTSAANPYLRLSGYLKVYNGGELDIGTSGTPIPRDSVAVLEFDCAADGDFGLVWGDGATVKTEGLSRTSGKNVFSCKLAADTTPTNLVAATVSGAMSGGTAGTGTGRTSFDPFGLIKGAASFVDTAANSNHGTTQASSGGSVTNTTQTYSIWLAAGSGTNKRFVRVCVGSTTSPTPTNGFFADVDLQAGTIGTCTAAGNGTATSSSITAHGVGFICTIVGKCSSAAATPITGAWACSAAGTVSYAGDATQNFLFNYQALWTNSGLPSKDLTVDTDTGWLTGDLVAIASTTRTIDDCEPNTMASDAGASTLHCTMNPAWNHSGTAPTQAEIILLSRNVKIRSVLNTAMTFASGNLPAGTQVGTAVVNMKWTEVYYAGTGATGKRGVEANPVAGSFSMTFCSIHDSEVNGVYFGVLVTWNNVTFSNNVMCNLATTTGPACQTGIATSGTAWTIDSNILLRTLNSNGWSLNDVGGTFTNNTVVGGASIAFSLIEAAPIGTISGLVAHSNAGNGIQGAAGLSGLMPSCTSWRNGGTGLSPAGAVELSMDDFVAFGNTTDNIQISTAINLTLTRPVLSADTSFATTNGIRLGTVTPVPAKIQIIDGDFSTVSGIKAAHTNDINIAFGPNWSQITMWNTKLGAATEIATPSNLSSAGFVSSQKHDQTAGLHKTWTRYGGNTGGLIIDSVIFHTAAPSQRVIPNTSVAKMESAPMGKGFLVAVASGATVTPSVYARKSVVGDAGGVAYAGAQPRLILRANPAIGIATDVVIATMTVSNASGSWEQLTGTTASATDDGVMEFVVDCDGTSGAWVNVDDWSA